MTPITIAIVVALTAGAGSGVTKAGEQAMVDVYAKFKELLGKKLGQKVK